MKYSVIISLLFVVLLPACSHNPQRADYSVDHYDLVRSAVYTQREVINTQFTEPASQTAALHAQRQAMLLSSYCDLIDRRTIFASAPAEACTEQTPKSASASVNFIAALKPVSCGAKTARAVSSQPWNVSTSQRHNL